jgi:hypothetical protein
MRSNELHICGVNIAIVNITHDKSEIQAIDPIMPPSPMAECYNK